jgi:putative membrane protein
MKSKIIIPITLGVACFIAGCSYRPIGGPVIPVLTSAQVHSDRDILGALVVLNKGEISAAQLAQKKTTNADVKNYAALMISEHGANLRQTEKLATQLHVKPNQQADVAAMLKNKGNKEFRMLKSFRGVAFDKAYVDAMVMDHAEALGLIDAFYNQASNGLLRNQLKMTRNHVADHLQRARILQVELSRS